MTRKVIIGVIATLITLGLIFCVTVLIMGSAHGLTFVEEIKSWFDTAKEVVPDPEPVVNVARSILKI